MVKASPRIPDRASRRRHRFDLKLRSHHRLLLKLASFSSSSSPPPPPPPSSSTTTQETLPTTTTTSKILQKSPSTPPSLSIRRRIKFMKRPRPRPSSSPSPSSSHSKSKASPSLSCSSSSSSPCLPLMNFFTQSPTTSKTAPFDRNVGPISSEKSPLPPLPPHPSPELLKRSVSDPVKLLPHLSCESGFSPMKSSPNGAVSRNLMGQLPPLPPSSSPSKLLRRTISEPVHLQSPISKEEEESARRKMKEKAVEAEKLSGEWIVVKFNCDCGKDGHYLVNAADKKYFKLI